MGHTEDMTDTTPESLRGQLREAGDEHRAVQASLSTVRENLGPLIAAALRAGIPQYEVHTLSGYRSRETVRAVARANGYKEDGRKRKADGGSQ